MPAPVSILNDQDGLTSAAAAVADVFGLGDGATASDQWPVDDGDSVLAAAFEGDVSGRMYLAVNDGVAGRLTSDPARLAAGLQKALDELGTRHGMELTVGDVGPSDERPQGIVEITDAGQLCALFGISFAEGAAAHTEAVTDPEVAGVADDTAVADGGAGGAGRQVGLAAAYEPQSFALGGHTSHVGGYGALDVLRDVDMEVTVELGRTRMPIRELLSLQPGMVIEIDRAAGAPIDVLVNGRMIACGEVVVVDEEFGIRITEIIGAPA